MYLTPDKKIYNYHNVRYEEKEIALKRQGKYNWKKFYTKDDAIT